MKLKTFMSICSKVERTIYYWEQWKDVEQTVDNAFFAADLAYDPLEALDDAEREYDAEETEDEYED